MTEKIPPVLSDEEITEIKPTHEEIDRINREAGRYEPKEFRGCYANDEITKVRRHRIAEAQRDDTYQKMLDAFEPFIQQAKGELLDTIEAMYPELRQVYWEGKDWQSLKSEYPKG